MRAEAKQAFLPCILCVFNWMYGGTADRLAHVNSLISVGTGIDAQGLVGKFVGWVRLRLSRNINIPMCHLHGRPLYAMNDTP